ncbi:MAG: peptide MFS transporter [Rikenellaceae bacterium]|nr:peptide MFS transporter [Rikenellaceae bacterium]
MFKGHPKGLFALALANTGERFGYYTMVAVFALFLRANFGFDAGTAGIIYSTFLGLVYFMPLIGGILADKYGFGKMVTLGISVMFAGYVLLSFPLGGNTLAMICMLAALLFISVGTGLFKGNLQVMVGNLYDDPKYASKRDSAFSLFYMAINIGALFAPTAAVKIKEWAEGLGFTSNDAYHFSFAVACVSLIASMAIYYLFRPTFRHVEGGKRKAGEQQIEDNLTPQETKQRVVALCLVFAVVIFFWMAFHQNGLALTYFADEFTATESFGLQSMAFNVWNLALVIIAVYATFSIFQSESAKGKLMSGAVGTAVLAFLVWRYTGLTDEAVAVSAPIFQQFNPFYVVALTPVSMAIFGALARKGKEPSAPRKIAYGMLVAAIGFVIMAVGSRGLNTPDVQSQGLAEEKGITLAEAYYAAPVTVTAEQKENGVKTKAEVAKEIVEYNQGLVDNKKNEKLQLAAIFAHSFATTYESALAANVVEQAPVEEVAPEEAPVVEEAVAEATAEVVEPIVAEEAVVEPEVVEPVVETVAVDENVAKVDAIIAAAPAETIKPVAPTRVSANWLIFTYLILTFAELLLSPMGISFVSKVAPPKLKGMMMGGWFVATAIGNLLVAVGGLLWGGFSLTVVWSVFIALCLLSALFMFVMMKRLESATK